jgi:hypothetical protein
VIGRVVIFTISPMVWRLCCGHAMLLESRVLVALKLVWSSVKFIWREASGRIVRIL